MRLQIKGQINIHASAEKVWHILARDYATIGQWASAIPYSTAVSDLPVPEGATIGGRTCANSVPGFGDVQEQLTYYDEKELRFGYWLTKGNPFFINSAENNWTIRATGSNQCMVEAHGVIDLKPMPGLFIAPLLKFQMKRLGKQTIEELKYYAENDQPHPRKLKAQQQQAYS